MPVTINGTTGIVNPDGTAAAPSLVGSDSNTGVFFPAADTVAVAAGGAEALRVDPSRNLMVGTATNTNGSKIVSNGVIESTTGGMRFPDGTTQTTAATAPTTANVTSAYAGASALSVGTHVIGRPANSTNYNAGDTVAGSALWMTYPGASYDGGWGTQPVTQVNVGTWRCMSRAAFLTFAGPTYQGVPGLWMRIS